MSSPTLTYFSFAGIIGRNLVTGILGEDKLFPTHLESSEKLVLQTNTTIWYSGSSMHASDPNNVEARRVVTCIVKQGVETRVSCSIDCPARSRKLGVCPIDSQARRRT